MIDSALISFVERIPEFRIFGRIKSVVGLRIEAEGLSSFVRIGTICKIQKDSTTFIRAEVAAIKDHIAILIPFGSVEGIAAGAKVEILNKDNAIYPCDAWRGRVLNAFGEAVDSLGMLPWGSQPYQLNNAPPNAHQRGRVHQKLDLGIRSLNTFTPCCDGQRMGIFAGSGVGKSVLISMMAKFTSADVIVIGLIGERGREVQEFLQEYLGEEGLKRSVVVIATSDEPALVRRQGAYTTIAIAEYFRDQGKHVLCLIDSLTRFALAQREIGLSIGEPPTTRGYTPSVFAELPKLLERAGPGISGQGNITGLFSVLVEGSDMDEPIADAVRGILDGHIVLERKIAERGRFPAVNVLKSVSRTMMVCNSEIENDLIRKARKYMALYEDMEELIRIGAYRKGSDPETDMAIELVEEFETFLSQKPYEQSNLHEGYEQLANILRDKK
jgi:flagellum-specific ATP synthase